MPESAAERPTIDMRQPAGEGLTEALDQNIKALVEHRRRRAAAATREDRVAQAITKFAGSMAFIYIHAAIYGFWIVANIGLLPIVPRWDPSLVILAMVASVEAIFLSTFVLISQNRLAAAEDKRAELNLQISLLAEHEVTRLIAIVSDIAARLQVRVDQTEVEELKKDVAPEAVLERIEETGRESG